MPTSLNIKNGVQHQYPDLIRLFNQTFEQAYNTRLVKGGDEPLYSPANETCPYHQIIFAHGYYASALHEIAHWCLAGEKRRLLEDFGYWYIPDGRDEKQQQTFEQVEIKPQAIEWGLCMAAQKSFNVSADNLHGFGANTQQFKRAVLTQVNAYFVSGFPKRAQQFMDVLAKYYHTPLPLRVEQFEMEQA